jgi:hypothetical protein
MPATIKTLKSSVARLLRSARRSRDQWKEKAQERHRQIRALQIRVRDLEASREKWKAKAQSLALEPSGERAPSDKPAKDSPEEGSEVEEGARPAGHHYPVPTIQRGIELLTQSHTSLRGTVQTLHLFEGWLTGSGLHFTTLRQWSYRLGLYWLTQPKAYRADWIWVVDQTLETGPQGCLVIVGIESERLVAGHFSPTHDDLQVLDLAVLSHANAEAVAERLQALSEQVGTPCQIVADHGSDVKKGIELFQQSHPQTIYTYDVSHALANELKRELRDDECWSGLLSQAHQTRQQVQQTELAFLAAPCQRSKARLMASERHVRWAEQVLAYHDRGDFSLIDPSYSIDWPTHEALLELWGPTARPAIASLHGRRFADRDQFRQALVERVGETAVAQLEPAVFERASRGRRRFQEKFAGLLAYRQELPLYSALIERVKLTQTVLKHHGLQRESKPTIEQAFQTLSCPHPRVARFSQRILDYLTQEGEKLSAGQTLLASSDCLESLFGKYKTFTEHNPIKEIGKRILLIPVLVTRITAEQVGKAMESVRNRDVDQWAREVCGQSMLAKRLEAFRGVKKDIKTA